MLAFAQKANVARLTVAQSIDFTSSGFRILNLVTGQNNVRLSSQLTVSGGVTSPTAQVVWQTSVDGVNWFDLAAGTSRTSAGTYFEVLDPNASLLGWVRAKVLLTGGTNFSITSFVADLVATEGIGLATS